MTPDRTEAFKRQCSKVNADMETLFRMFADGYCSDPTGNLDLRSARATLKVIMGEQVSPVFAEGRAA